MLIYQVIDNEFDGEYIKEDVLYSSKESAYKHIEAHKESRTYLNDWIATIEDEIEYYGQELLDEIKACKASDKYGKLLIRLESYTLVEMELR
jgi:hypothetical protein